MEVFYERAGLAALLAATVFAAYFFKHLVEALGRRRQEASKAERLICALYAEIAANTQDLEEFLSTSPPLERVKQAVRENAALRPHITSVCHRIVYESHLTELADLPRPVILKVVAFYCQIERLVALIDGFERPSFEQISDERRGQVVEELWRTVKRGVRLGHEVLHGLEVHAPLELTRDALKPA
jgi:very-short-patch-repair endonuclease